LPVPGIRYHPGFRQKFREAYSQALGPVSISLVMADGSDVDRFPVAPGYPMFGDRDLDNTQGGEYVLTFKFMLPLGTAYGEQRIFGYTMFSAGEKMLTVQFDEPMVKIATLPGVIFLNLAL